MEFLVEFELHIPDTAPESEVDARQKAEAAAAATLAGQGHLVRLWKVSADRPHATALGLYRAANLEELTALLQALPLYEWLQTSITPLLQHPNDPQ